MNSLTAPPTSPAEVLEVSPENLVVCNAYLTHQTIEGAASSLELEPSHVAQVLSQSSSKSYISTVFQDWGFNNRFKIRSALDAVISRKFQEMDEAGVGSSKDIAELLELSHKMSIKELELQISLEKARTKTSPSKVTNVQVNDHSGSNYNKLLESLLKNVAN